MSAGVDVEVLATGYQLAEAPRVDADGGVWFTDALGGGIHRWSPDGVEVVVPKRRGVGGLALHADSGVVCGGRDLRHVRPGEPDRVLWSPPEEVRVINDLCAIPGGAIVFGVLRFLPFAAEDPVPGEFRHLDADHECIYVTDILWANGCGVDEARSCIYFCDYANGNVWCRDPEGVRLLATTPNGHADGLAVDAEGGVWVAAGDRGSVIRFTPDGALADEVHIGGFVASLAFDGADAMYVTTAAAGGGTEGSLLRLPAPVPGPRHLLATV